METTKDTRLGGWQSPFSRRTFLKGAAALAAAGSAPNAFGQPPTGAPPRTVWLYVGTYTGSPGPAEGAACGMSYASSIFPRGR